MTDQEPTIDRRSTEGRINLVVRRSFRSGQYIFREREIGDFANVVCFDNVEIVKKRDNQEVVLGTLGKGTMFGELALIDNESRMASARATDGNVELLMVARDTFQRKLSSLNPFSRELIKILA